MQLCFIIDTMSPRLVQKKKKKIWQGIDKSDGGRAGKSELQAHLSWVCLRSQHQKPRARPCTNVSVLGREMFPELWVLKARARGNSVSPRRGGSVSQGHSDLDSGGKNKQVV